MTKLQPNKPVLIMLYGYPGSGKTYFARQFCEHIHAAHLEYDRVRFELFDQPRFTKQENFAVTKIMDFMAGEFLAAGISVVYDANAMRISQRMAIREIAYKHKAKPLVIWFQVDPDTAFLRNHKRDRRLTDDRYAAGYDVEQFKQLIAYMQHPEPTEEYIVISGKHTFPSHLSNVSRKLADMGILQRSSAASKMAKPKMVNLIPNPSSFTSDPEPEPEPDLPPGYVAPPPRPQRRNIVLR